MKSRHALLLLAAAAGPAALLVSSCSKTDDSPSTVEVVKNDAKVVIQDAKVTVTDAAVHVKDAVSDSWDTVSGYSFDKRAEFSARIGRMEEAMDTKVHEMNDKLTGLPDDAAKDRDAAVREFNKARADLKARLADLGDATADTWADAKGKVNEAWKHMQAAYDRMKPAAGT